MTVYNRGTKEYSALINLFPEGTFQSCKSPSKITVEDVENTESSQEMKNTSSEAKVKLSVWVLPLQMPFMGGGDFKTCVLSKVDVDNVISVVQNSSDYSSSVEGSLSNDNNTQVDTPRGRGWTGCP